MKHAGAPIAILGWGTALPPERISQEDAGKLASSLNGHTERQGRAIAALYHRSGIVTRHSVLLEPAPTGAPGQSFFPHVAGPEDRGPTIRERMARYERDAPPLAIAAARAALAEAAAAASPDTLPASPDAIATVTLDVAQLVTVSCTGFCAPGVDLALIEALGLPATTPRTNVGFMGCHGALNGLRVAAALAAAEPGRAVLLCAVELCSLHYQYGYDPDRVLANALFADGAAALVLRAEPESGEPQRGERANEPPDRAPLRLAAQGSVLIPESADAMSWRIDDHGFVMTLAPSVPRLIETHLRPWMDAWLAGQGLTVGDIASWAIHPGGPRILSAAEHALGLTPAATAVSREVLAACGNMSSPTILFILSRLAAAAAPRPCVALAFGPGLIAEAALFV